MPSAGAVVGELCAPGGAGGGQGGGVADRAAEREPSQTRRPLSAEDLQAYAERESAAEKLEEFEGGRGRYIETTTVIIVLLALIVLLLIF